ncbi:MAG: glutamine--fructose-6-phosphate transaminase (isomerizing) [Rhizonema sp. NSF051]|nr:glutamine--fructose-6-phosphate transaminase (isomerizing) [Rhizonema sp. NSF051]
MCGIVGYVGIQSASETLLEGLRHLEYRGYDSAGIATVWEGELHCVRAKGKLNNLREKLERIEMPARIGIGHTRWATHGKPEECNAHPHRDQTNRVAVVQNGIIENYRELKQELQAKGYTFVSETDTEVIPHLITNLLDQMQSANELVDYTSPLTEAVRRTVNRLEGAFAIAVICKEYPDELVVARQQAPLVIGLAGGEYFCASDVPAILPYTNTVVKLENGEMATLTPLGVAISSFAGDRIIKYPHVLKGNRMTADKQGFRHYMLKEIHEQPDVVRDCLSTYLSSQSKGSPIALGLPDDLFTDLQQVQILACGTSWHASLVGKYLIEQLASLPTTVHYASEYRYAPSPLLPQTLMIGVTQSGETADTLAALEMEHKRRTQRSTEFRPRLLGITNRPESTLAQLVPHLIVTPAGIEMGVAATKTFTAQLMAFYILALDLAARRQTLTPERMEEIVVGLRHIPTQIEQVLYQQSTVIEELSHRFQETQDFIFLGRGINFPIALEGALKLKEISYIHAEGYPAGEMKHGPIALLDAKVPVLTIATPGAVYDKVLSNAQEAKARDAQLIGVAPQDEQTAELFDVLLPIPKVEEILSPILTLLPLQMLAYHIAATRGLDVDQPRNLAKSVTVE